MDNFEELKNEVIGCLDILLSGFNIDYDFYMEDGVSTLKIGNTATYYCQGLSVNQIICLAMNYVLLEIERSK